MGKVSYVSRSEGESALRLWVSGWEVFFHIGDKPVAKKSVPPAEVSTPADTGEVVETIGDGAIGVSWKKMVVIIRETGEPSVLREKLASTAASKHFLKVLNAPAD